MSLFQAREWWSAQAGQEEEFDSGCLCIANVDNEPGGTNKIITGSFQGMLRMYCPKQKEYKIEDLILEKNLEMPILQIEAGRLVQGSRELCLALLHPMKLSIYKISAVSSGGSVNYYSMIPAYEHQLTRPCFNMCYGPFGGTQHRDYICIQSLDGVLSFFEQEAFAFNRLLSSNFLVPGPLCYFPKTDSFIICNNSMCIEAYRYQVLAAAADNVDREPGAEGASGKKVQVDWSTNIGEHAQHIEVTRFSRSLSASQQEILVIGERTLFTIKENGGIRLQKRLSEYSIACARCYKLMPEGPDAAPLHNLLVGTTSGHLMVFQEMHLVWCARLHNMVPIQISVADIGGVRGMICTMDDNGKVQVSYLGTDPPMASLVNTEMKELNYDEMEEEHQDLLRVIRQTHGEGAREAEEILNIEPQVPQSLDVSHEDDTDPDDPYGRVDGAVMQCTVRLVLALHGRKAIENVTVAIKAPNCFTTSQTSIHIDKVSPGEQPVIPIVFRVFNQVLCAGLTVLATASYYSGNNEPRTTVVEFRLPFALVAKLIQPVKSATYKLQLDCNRQPPALQTLFQDMLSQPHVPSSFGQGMSNLVSVQYVSGTEATVLVSKQACRFTVQASEFASLWVLTQELSLRLAQFYETQENGQSDDPFTISYQDSLPLHDYFALMDDHFTFRKHLEELRADLADRTQQYRVIQKRLLVRFKDRNPSPLNHLDALLALSFEQTVQLTEAIDDVERALRQVSCHLSAATELVLLLIRFRFELDEDNFKVLRLHLSPEIFDTVDQGWEEQVDASLMHLLRTSLARNAKDRSSLPPPMKVPQDTLKLKKRITSVVDRLANGGRITGDEVEGSMMPGNSGHYAEDVDDVGEEAPPEEEYGDA
jgi:Bardet-Biedl syndrome 9 protein